MEATRLRWIKSGQEYDKLFPRAEGGVITVKKNASLEDTIAFIPKVIQQHFRQTKQIAARLKGATIFDTCSNIWDFVYHHIQYRKDQNGYEQIRSPARAWRDRQQGVDCDCYSVFISSILFNLSIPHILRITKYRQDYFQHIYPVVPCEQGEIIIDCVTNDFNYEVPYSAKKDFPMDLQLLNGFDDPAAFSGDPASDTGMGDLGKFKFKKILSTINKFNPATILLRNGLLVSMKLNIGGVAKKLRWSYLTPAQAAAKGMHAPTLSKLTKVRSKLESIFTTAGGNLKNLKKAILKGKGNKDKQVMAGLGDIDFGNIDAMGIHTPLEQLLGAEMYHSENERTFVGLAGFGSLGEPVTLTSVAAASGVIVSLVAALKKIGNLFSGKGEPGAGPGTAAAAEDTQTSSTTNSGEEAAPSPAAGRSSKMVATSDTNSEPLTPGPVLTTSVIKGEAAADGEAADPTNALTANPTSMKAGFWEQHKSWLKPVALGAGGLVVLAVAVHFLKPISPPAAKPLSGPPSSRHHHRKKKKHVKKTAVALI